MTPTRRQELNGYISEADALANMLEHVAWQDTIQPHFEKLEKLLNDLLMKLVLGQPTEQISVGGIVVETKEQAAGLLFGLRTMRKMFENILAKGAKSLEILNNENIKRQN